MIQIQTTYRNKEERKKAKIDTQTEGSKSKRQEVENGPANFCWVTLHFVLRFCPIFGVLHALFLTLLMAGTSLVQSYSYSACVNVVSCKELPLFYLYQILSF